MTALLIPIALSMGWAACGIVSALLMECWGGPDSLTIPAFAARSVIVALGPIGLLLLGLAWVAVGRGE